MFLCSFAVGIINCGNNGWTVQPPLKPGAHGNIAAQAFYWIEKVYRILSTALIWLIMFVPLYRGSSIFAIIFLQECISNNVQVAMPRYFHIKVYSLSAAFARWPVKDSLVTFLIHLFFNTGCPQCFLFRCQIKINFRFKIIKGFFKNGLATKAYFFFFHPKWKANMPSKCWITFQKLWGITSVSDAI